MKLIKNRVFIIAEAGVNHNGNLNIARRLIDVAVAAGADAVKFQTFKAESVVSRYAPKAAYQKKTTEKDETQLEMIKKLELDLSAHKELMRYCRRKKIGFLSSPFDLESINLLARLGLKIFKIPSGEITNLPYLRKIGSLRKKIIMSTGMAELKEIKDAIDILLINGTKKEDITVLHCNTEYPTPFKDANLAAILTIKDSLGVRVGYSDHTLGIEAAIAAVALGASVVEKHFTLDKNMLGPDHRSSIEPQELKAMVRSIRNISEALGSGVKKPSPSEIKNKSMARKNIVALNNILEGELFTEDNITVKRCREGISPMEWDKVIGKKAKKNFGEDELIQI